MDSFRDIVDTYSLQVYRHALKLLKNNEEAEEATQDIFMKIHKAIHLFRGDAKLSTWIWRITVNECYTRLSKKKIPVDPITEKENEIPRPDTIFSSIVEAERSTIVESVLTRIPSQQASILMMFYRDEMSYQEIAEVFNMPEGTVATLLHRGRENMRKELSRSYKDLL
jgi:RNA polymerase sigma-70 factor (ECF subfamily)